MYKPPTKNKPVSDRQPIQIDNAYKETITKFLTSPPSSLHHPKERNPILQQDEKTKEKKTVKIEPISKATEKPKGRAPGQYFTKSSKSDIFAEPSSSFIPSRKYIQPSAYEKPSLTSLKKSNWQPERRDPILQVSVSEAKIKVRDKNFQSSAFDHMGKFEVLETTERKGKYFDQMNSSIFSNHSEAELPSRRIPAKNGEIGEVISYKSNQGYRDSISIKDPNQNTINKVDLKQSKALSQTAAVFKHRDLQSGVFS